MRQIPTLILPTYLGQITPPVVTVETIGDALTHVSDSLPVWMLQEKTAYIYAVAAGGPAALNVWVEFAPYDVAALYVPLTAPTVFAATRNDIIAWATHSEFARVVAQCPLWAAGSWTVAVWFEAK